VPDAPEQVHGENTVRPRWVWSGLILTLLGAFLLALWFDTWYRSALLAGGILLAAGVGVAVRGGILYDTHGRRPVTGEVDDVRDADVHRGTAPGDTIADEALREEARATSRRTRALLRAAEATPRPHLYRAGGMLLVLGAALPPCAQALYPHTQTGQDNAVRALLLAVLAGLAGLRILLGQRPGRPAFAVAALAGIALVLLALLTDHERTATTVVEIVGGAAMIVGAALALDRPRPSEGAPRPSGQAPALSPACDPAPGTD